MRASCERSGEDEEQKEEEAMAACGRLSGVPEAVQGAEADWDSDWEMEGTHGLGELVRDTLYLRSCRAHSVVPVSCFLRQGSAQELNLRHRGLGPQVPLEGHCIQAYRESLSPTLPSFCLCQACLTLHIWETDGVEAVTGGVKGWGTCRLLTSWGFRESWGWEETFTEPERRSRCHLKQVGRGGLSSWRRWSGLSPGA
uniref:Uncharacterized protein n=1 Tax=Papio anubis TaxID=9555 RepID=A0A8I5NE02_PAPAN